MHLKHRNQCEHCAGMAFHGWACYCLMLTINSAFQQMDNENEREKLLEKQSRYADVYSTFLREGLPESERSHWRAKMPN